MCIFQTKIKTKTNKRPVLIKIGTNTYGSGCNFDAILLLYFFIYMDMRFLCSVSVIIKKVLFPVINYYYLKNIFLKIFHDINS